jgi:hypothetical protein
MEDKSQPRLYHEWRNEAFDREEDAAYTFGKHFIKYCRDEVVNKLSKDATENELKKITEAINTSLHNVMDLFEGYWKLKSGDDYSIEYVLQVVVKNKDGKELEKVILSPSKLDLPIGFWKWAVDGEFR